MITTAAVEDPALVRRTAEMLGAQYKTISADVRRDEVLGLCVFTHSGQVRHELVAANLLAHTAGLSDRKVLLNSINEDDKIQSYDLPIGRIAATDRMRCGREFSALSR